MKRMHIEKERANVKFSNLYVIVRALKKSIEKKRLIVTTYGTKEKFYSLRGLAKALGKPYNTVFLWKKAGYIPLPIYKFQNRMVYSETQCKYIKDFIKILENNTLYLTGLDMRLFLDKVWTEPYVDFGYSFYLIKKISREAKAYEPEERQN